MRLRRQPKEAPQAGVPTMNLTNVPDNLVNEAVRNTLLDSLGENVKGIQFDMDGVYDQLRTLRATVIDLNTRLMQLEGDEYEDNDE